MKEIISSEHMEQCGFITWFRLKFPNTLIFAIPNGGKRSIGAAVKLKDEGVIAGVPDLMIPEWHCFVEMKRVKGGKISPSQESIISYLTHIGYVVIVGYGATDASRQILEMREMKKE